MSKTEKNYYPLYKPDSDVQSMLRTQKITKAGETPQQMIERVIGTIFSVEQSFGTDPSLVKKMEQQLAKYMVKQYMMPGTPTLTNAGRNLDSALSSCVVIPVDLHDKITAAETIKAYYRQNMGSGFDLTPYEDPVELLNWINNLSAQETATGTYDRYIGNMGSIHVSHPKIQEFIDAKRVDGVIKHFNISVDLTSDFIEAVIRKKKFLLSDGRSINARILFHKMAENAWRTGDPGILFLDRMNQDNPVRNTSRYVSTPPCGEMGLSEGETCQFGYINLAKFVHDKKIDWNTLAKVTRLTVRALDNAVEYSIQRYPDGSSAQITLMKRKIGVGVCGLAEMLIYCDLAYDSHEGRSLAKDTLAFINYNSKIESVYLAEQRGSCLAMSDKKNNRYYDGFLENKYAKILTKTVSKEQWVELSNDIKQLGKLRNILTTALPPTGRSSIMLGVTPSIEPFFSVFGRDGKIKKSIIKYICSQKNIKNKQAIISSAQLAGSFQHIEVLPDDIKTVLRTAKEISVYGHVSMVAALAGVDGVIDETASKTVNLPNSASISDVEEIYLMAHELGLKNISVYRDGSKIGQPTEL